MCAPTFTSSSVAYHSFDPAIFFIGFTALSSITNDGFASVSIAKKKSEPRPIHPVPSCRALASKVRVIAMRRSGLPEFASAIKSGACIFCCAKAGRVNNATRARYLLMVRRLYCSAITLGKLWHRQTRLVRQAEVSSQICPWIYGISSLSTMPECVITPGPVRTQRMKLLRRGLGCTSENTQISNVQSEHAEEFENGRRAFP